MHGVRGHGMGECDAAVMPRGLKRKSQENRVIQNFGKLTFPLNKPGRISL
jgi:hypothetical protein